MSGHAAEEWGIIIASSRAVVSCVLFIRVVNCCVILHSFCEDVMSKTGPSRPTSYSYCKAYLTDCKKHSNQGSLTCILRTNKQLRIEIQEWLKGYLNPRKKRWGTLHSKGSGPRISMLHSCAILLFGAVEEGQITIEAMLRVKTSTSNMVKVSSCSSITQSIRHFIEASTWTK